MRLLILGTGHMAATHFQNFSAIDGVRIVAAVDIEPARLISFCDRYGIENRFASFEEALAWNGFDAVANVTPDASHRATTLAALNGGKHVFCEKPLATNAADAIEMTEAADRSGLVGMVNLSYRNVPELHRFRELVLDGAIGAVRHIDAAYLQSWLVANTYGDWRTERGLLWKLSRRHGSNGVLGDLGIHLADLATFGTAQEIIAVSGMLGTFDKAEANRIGEYGLDANDSFVFTAKFANGAIGVLHSTRWASGHANSLFLRAYGDKGGLELKHGPEGSTLSLCSGDDVSSTTWRPVAAPAVPSTYALFAEAVRERRSKSPTFREAASLQRVLDAAESAAIAGQLMASPSLAFCATSRDESGRSIV